MRHFGWRKQHFKSLRHKTMAHYVLGKKCRSDLNFYSWVRYDLNDSLQKTPIKLGRKTHNIVEQKEVSRLWWRYIIIEREFYKYIPIFYRFYPEVMHHQCFKWGGSGSGKSIACSLEILRPEYGETLVYKEREKLW